ncbi:MAG: universal stress protein [Gammaproteobacteria bacterium]
MNILVGVDLSGCTDTIIEQAKALAKALSAKVWLIHVAEPEPDFVGYDAGPQSERDAIAKIFHREHTELQTLAKQLRADGVETTALLIRGPTAETILNEGSKLNADMVIVGSHGRGAMQRLLMGSVSEAVLRRTDRPILIVPTHSRAAQ